MAYNGGYGPEPPYAGRAGSRPSRGGRGGPPPQHQQYHGAPPQQYNGYADGYGYDGGYNHDAGYGQDYNDPYGHREPPRGHPDSQRQHADYYGPNGGRGGQPPPGSHDRGAYQPRGRGGMLPGAGSGPGPRPRPDRGGRGRPPIQTGYHEPNNHPPNMYDPPVSPRGPSYSNGYGRPGEMDHMTNRMGGMDLNGQRGPAPPSSRGSAESHQSQSAYGRPPTNGRGPPRGQQQGYFDPRSGQSQSHNSAEYGGYDDGYNGAQTPQHEFGPPMRSMTMPHASERDIPEPTRTPYDNHAGRGMPQRPASSADHRPTPQHHYSQHDQGYQYDHYGGGYDDGQSYGQQPLQQQEQQHQQQEPGGYGQPHNDYYGGHQGFQGQSAQHRIQPSQSTLPDFELIASNARGSFEQTMRPGPEQPQPGAHQTAVLNHAQSQPDLRQPQTAIFEMAGDIPSVPPMPPMSSAPTSRKHSAVGGPAAHERMPMRGPSAPPGMTSVPGPSRMGPASAKSDSPSQPVPNRNPDALPSHPTPVRAGLIANSVVNLKDKPPPVRNYGGVPQGPPQPQGHQAVPQRHAQPQVQPNQPPAPARGPPVKVPEAPVTPQELEHLRMVIKNNPNDQESALRLARRLIEAADVLVQTMPDAKSRGRARERYVMDAHKILKKLSNAQNVDAMFTMADSLGRGMFGGDSDTKEAFTLYQSAAKLGHAGAAYRTAVCCEIGQDEGGGTRKDPMKAFQWYKRAASLGDTPAMYKVGMILLKGLLGQPRNPREAVSWLKRAAERADVDNPHALHELGLLYENAQPNDAIIRDEQYAMRLFEQGADLGYKYSQFRLGCAFEYGLMGCPVDPTRSIMWYSKAAQRQEHQAELALSGWYLTGSEGVLKQSDQEAYLWARKAAIAGLAKAEYAMGYFTEVGIGTPANLEDAKRWYWRAAAQDFPKARERLEDLKRGRNSGGAPRQRERISRGGMENHKEGDCVVM